MPHQDDPHREARETTAAYIRGMLDANPDMKTGMTRDDLIDLGKYLWPASYALTQDDDEAFNKLAAAFQNTVRYANMIGDHAPLMTASSFLYMPMEQALMFWAARWADQGFPVIQMGHKYAAALMSTGVNADPEDIRPPFKAFFIQVPSGLLSIDDTAAGKEREVTYIIVHHTTGAEHRWHFVAAAERISLWRHGCTTVDMIDPSDVRQDGIDWSSYSFGIGMDDRDQRTYLLIQRLILNTCLAMTTPGNTRPLGKSAKLSVQSLRDAPEPLARVYQVGKPIKLDCRPAVESYLSGQRRGPVNVQCLVRGHWKRQAHGPKRSLRKWAWIEPYWRGPEDAPILTRPHKLDDGV